MSYFHFEKKVEHEKAAEKALMEDDFQSAFYHVTEAARFTLALARQCPGQLCNAYTSNANELMDLAETCKAKCAKRSGGEKMSVEGDETKKLNDCLVERPSVRMADVAGMEDVKRQIRPRMIESLQHVEKAPLPALLDQPEDLEHMKSTERLKKLLGDK